MRLSLAGDARLLQTRQGLWFLLGPLKTATVLIRSSQGWVFLTQQDYFLLLCWHNGDQNVR